MPRAKRIIVYGLKGKGYLLAVFSGVIRFICKNTEMDHWSTEN